MTPTTTAVCREVELKDKVAPLSSRERKPKRAVSSRLLSSSARATANRHRRATATKVFILTEEEEGGGGVSRHEIIDKEVLTDQVLMIVVKMMKIMVTLIRCLIITLTISTCIILTMMIVKRLEQQKR